MALKHFVEEVQPCGAVRFIGFADTTDYLSLKKKGASDFPIARKAAEQAYAMAGIGPRDIDGAEVQRLLLNVEIVQYEILGLAERGEGVQLIESGATSLPSGRLPVNAGGGLIGDGHPVGAAGC